jgi:hypothetical protein
MEAANHHGVQTSPLVACRRTLAPPRLAAPPPSRGGGGSRGDIQQNRRSSTPPPVLFSSPPLHASLSPGVDGARRSVLQELSPPPSASPINGVADRACRLGTNTIPSSHHISNTAPFWASVVRDGVHAKHAGISRQDFLDLYERCSDSGLRTCLILRHQAGVRKISISCRLSASPLNANAPSDFRRRRRQCKRALAAAVSIPALPTLPAESSPPPSTQHDAPCQAETASPPAKRTQIAARRRCEVELLRESDSEEELQLSPVF